jgi:hypothetical protein
MAVQTFSTTPRRLAGGDTGLERSNRFFSIEITGVDELLQNLDRAALRAGRASQPFLQRAVIEASRPILQGYRAKINDVTGNLARSTVTRKGKREYPGVAIAVTGPSHFIGGTDWDVGRRGGGNHAWLLEYGTGRRRPATEGRRTYINVHQKINKRWSKLPDKGFPFTNEQFERMGKGFYFLMSSYNEPTRRARRGRGYPHDFLPDGRGGIRPFAIGPGETYGAMEGKGPMEKTVAENSGAVQAALRTALQEYVRNLTAG